MKLAIVHDFLNQYGGAEKCIEAFHEIFPRAPIYTSIFLSEKMPNSFRQMDIRTSFMQKLPGLGKHFKKYLMLYPKAMESFNLKEYDIIISSSSAFAKGIRKNNSAIHVCYCYSPMRFVWDSRNYFEKENLNSTYKVCLPVLLSRLKKWDLERNKDIDYFISISEHIKSRIKKCYQRDSIVIYPPVDVSSFAISEQIEDYYLVVSRLNAYKRIDMVIEAFNRLQLPLRIVGEGPFRPCLEKMAGPTIQFMGRLDENELVKQYEHCKAYVFPGKEDFGIAPVEAQSAGRPVIAYADGGALETVIDGKTGVFFKEPQVGSLCDAVLRLDKLKLFNKDIRNHAQQFGKEVFKKNIVEYLQAIDKRRRD
jgi:glycosyltransferase involved in cell wall biosynthesis